MWTSPTLEAGSWSEDTGAIQVPGRLNADKVEVVAVTLSVPFTGERLFVRVQAAE